jgi:hypothetical protein
MMDAVLNERSPFYHMPQVQVWAQMDYTTASSVNRGRSTTDDRSVFPQIELLDEIHTVAENSTFVMLFRPVEDWIRSVKAWNRYPFRLAQLDVPGLILTEEQRYSRDTLGETIVVTEQQLKQWWCHRKYLSRSGCTIKPWTFCNK